eukprot:s25_g33.t1
MQCHGFCNLCTAAGHPLDFWPIHVATALWPEKRLVEEQFEFAGRLHTGHWCLDEGHQATFACPGNLPHGAGRIQHQYDSAGGGRWRASRHTPRNAGKLALEDVKAEPAEISVPEPFRNVFQTFLACSAPPKKKEVQPHYSTSLDCKS